MKQIKKTAIKLWKDESGQGTAEYVLILVAIVAIGMLFKKQITEAVGEAMGNVKTKISGFTGS